MLKCTWLCIIIAIWIFARLIFFLIPSAYSTTNSWLICIYQGRHGHSTMYTSHSWEWAGDECGFMAVVNYFMTWQRLRMGSLASLTTTTLCHRGYTRTERSKRRPRCSGCHLGQSRGIWCSLIDGDLLKDLSESEDDDGDETCIKRDLMFDVVAVPC